MKLLIEGFRITFMLDWLILLIFGEKGVNQTGNFHSLAEKSNGKTSSIREFFFLSVDVTK